MKDHDGTQRQQQDEMADDINDVLCSLAHVLAQEVNAHVPVTDKRSGHCQHQHDTEEVPLQIAQTGQRQL